MKKFFALVGVDRAVLVTLVFRAWQILAGLGSILAVSGTLTLELQGYFYTFYSLIALQVFAEMGLTSVVVQFASHECAHLTVFNGVFEEDATIGANSSSSFLSCVKP